MKNLYLVRGLPGAGKSTIANALGNVVLAADMFHTDENGVYNYDTSKAREAHEWCRNETQRAMTHEVTIAVANTFVRDSEIQPYIDLAKIYGYRVHTIVVENRHGSENVHGVTPDIIGRMREAFEVELG